MKTHKNKGFTLAEILITLGIIGVVAALATPALIQHAASAKVGPAFSRCYTILSTGFQDYLYDNQASTVFMADPTIGSKPLEIFKVLADNHVKMKLDDTISAKDIKASVTGNAVLSAGDANVFVFNDKSAVFITNSECKFSNTVERCSFYFLPMGWINKDIIVLGEDAFEMAYTNKGDIDIYGLDYGDHWTTYCTDDLAKSFGPSSDRKSCGGRIAAHGFKKDY